MVRLAGVVAIAFLAACNSGDRAQQSVGPPSISIAVSPSIVVLGPSAQQQFNVTFLGTSSQAVAWAVAEGPRGGSASSTGLYTAPAAEGVYHVVVALQSDASQTATATVTVSAQPMVSVKIDPTSVVLPAGATHSFMATVTGSSNTGVRWSVQESDGGGIDDSGHYAAPPMPGTFHVVAASRADPTKMAVATVTVEALPPTVTVSISPSAVTVEVGGHQQFTAIVAGSTDQRVVWAVQEGTSGGTISKDGVYTTPTTVGAFHIVATAVIDSTKSATVAVTVTTQPPPPTISVSISPTSSSLAMGSTYRFTATVTGTPDQAVIWSVQEGQSGGSVDGSGLYTAPADAGTYHVVATSRADPTKSATAVVAVAIGPPPPVVSITISPNSTSLVAGSSTQFHATVTGTLDTTATWSILEGSSGGTVDGSGNYVAPTAAGTYHVVATSHADSTKSATATVTATARTTTISIDPASVTTWPVTTVAFAAKVTTGPATRIVWTVQEANGGQIDSKWGNYTAPSTTGVYHVGATNQTSGETATAAVTVTTSGIVVTINGSSHLVISFHDHVGSIALAATVHGTSNQGVSWAALDGGTVGYQGSTAYYYPPTTPGIYHVQATSQADKSAQAILIVELTYDDVLDFGGSVLPSSRTYAIWWGGKAAFAADMIPSIEAFLGGINGTPYLMLLNQYLRGATAATSFAGSLYDGSTPPAQAPSSTDVATEVCKVLDANRITPRSDGIYLVYTSNFATQAAALYCGWHSYSSCHGIPIQTSLIPNPANSPCDSAPQLQCNQMSQETTNVVLATAHELAETITDPNVSAWFTYQGLEIGDKCVYDARQCVSLGGSTWESPALWSNQIHDCAHQ